MKKGLRLRGNWEEGRPKTSQEEARMGRVKDPWSRLGAKWLDLRHLVGAEPTGLAEGADG